MPAALRTGEVRPSAPTVSGASITEPSARVTRDIAAPASTPVTEAGARTSMPAAVTASDSATRMRRFSTI